MRPYATCAAHIGKDDPQQSDCRRLALARGNVMNLLWLVALTLFVLREGLGLKANSTPGGGGLVAIVAGIMFLANALI
jgi:hypothetical protein